MTHTAGLALIHVRHDHFRLAFLHGKRLGMALVAQKGVMAGVVEINIFYGCFIFQHSRVISRFPDGGFILVATVAVIKRRTVLGSMAGKTSFLVGMVVEVNFDVSLSIGKPFGMTGFASGFHLMAFVLE